jgi:hypothetical protein
MKVGWTAVDQAPRRRLGTLGAARPRDFQQRAGPPCPDRIDFAAMDMNIRSLPGRWIATAGIAAALFFSGCASIRNAQARKDYLKEKLDKYEIQVDLDTAWPKVLTMLAENGFELGGKDREKVGQTERGILALFNRSSETHPSGKNQQALETDWSIEKVRYRVEGTRVSDKSCKINFFLIKQDESKDNHETMVGRDHEAELGLLRRVLPDASAGFDDEADAIDAK